MLYLYPANQFVAGFVGTPPMNFLTMDIVTEEGQFTWSTTDWKCLFLQTWQLAQGLSKDKVLMGIRPQDVHLADEARMIENPGWVLHCVSDVAERLGTETYVHFTLDDFELVDAFLLCAQFPWHGVWHLHGYDWCTSVWFGYRSTSVQWHCSRKNGNQVRTEGRATAENGGAVWRVRKGTELSFIEQ